MLKKIYLALESGIVGALGGYGFYYIMGSLLAGLLLGIALGASILAMRTVGVQKGD